MANDNIKDSINALNTGDSSAFKNMIQQELLSRAKESISTQRIVAGQTFFDLVQVPLSHGRMQSIPLDTCELI